MKKFLENTLVFCAYAFVFLWVGDFDSWNALQERILGQGPDPYQYIWNAFNFENQVSEGANPFFSPLLMHPEGTTLVMHTYTPIIGIFNIWIKNPYLSCNLVLLLSFGLSGLGAFLLSKHFVKNTFWALAVGFIFAFSPFKTTHLLEHYHLLLTATIPFIILYTLQAFPNHKLSLTKDNWIKVILLLALLSVTVLSDYYTTFAALVFLSSYFIFDWVRGLKSKHWVLIILGGFVVSHLIIEPIHINQSLDNKGAFYNAADVLAVVTPPENSYVYQLWDLEHWRHKLAFKGINEQVSFVGFGLLVFFLLALWRGGNSELKYWSLLLTLIACLAWPKVKIGGTSITYSPTAFLHYVPFFNNIRNPSRILMLMYLILPIWIAIRIEKWKVKACTKRILAIVFLGFSVFEFLPSTYPERARAEVEPIFHTLANLEPGALLTVPTGIVDGFQQVGSFDVKNLQRQIVHNKPMVGGYISRVDSATFAEFRGIELLAQFESFKYAKTENNLLLLPTSAWERGLHGLNISYVVIDKRKAPKPIQSQIKNDLRTLLSELREGPDFVLYKVLK